MIKIPAKGLPERLRNAASAASLQGAWWTRWDLVHLAVEAAAELESRDQRIKELQQVLSDHALGVEGGGGNRVHEDRCPLCIQCGGYGTPGTDDLASIAHKPDCRVEGLLRG